MAWQFKNDSHSTLNGAIDNSVTSLVVTSATPFSTVNDFVIKIDAEYMLVTAVSGTTFTVTRAYDGSSAASHTDLAVVKQVVTATIMTDINNKSGQVFIGARVFNSANQTVTASVETLMTFDSEVFDTDGFHSTSTNTGRFTIPVGLDGKYLVMGTFACSSSPGAYYSAFYKNGSYLDGGLFQGETGTGNFSVPGFLLVDLAAGDYIEFKGYRTSGTTFTGGGAGASQRCEFALVKITSGIGGALTSASYKRTSADYTTTSASFVDIDSTNLALTIITGARRVLVTFQGTANNSGAGQDVYFDLAIDGTREGNTNRGISGFTAPGASYAIPVTYSYITDALTAGSHTFKMQWATTGGTATLRGGTSSLANCKFVVYELPDSAPANRGSTYQSLTRTAGNITLSGSVTTMAEASSALRLSIAAAVGDVIQVSLSSIFNAGTGGEAAIDSATIVSGAINHQITAGTRGIGHSYMSGVSATAVTGTLHYVVVADDIVSGVVTFSPTYINSSGSTGLLYGTSTYTLSYRLINLGH